LSYEHEWNPLDPNERKELSKYFHVPRSTLNKLSYIECELLIQHLIEKIINLGYIKPYWNEKSIDAELKRLKGLLNVYYHGSFDIYPAQRGRPARELIERYYDISKMHCGDAKRTLDIAFSAKEILFVTLQNLIHRRKWDLNITTIHSMLYASRRGPKWYNPTVLNIILRQMFDITSDTILVDATPNINEKALTAWMLGCKYATLDGSSPPDELISKIGLNVVKAQKPYDLLVVDNGFKPLAIDRIRELLDMSRNMIIYISADQAKSVSDQLHPSRAVKVKVTPIRIKRKPDFLFIYRTAKIL